jgi:hypothetical protein
VIWLLTFPLPPSPIRKLDRRRTRRLRKRENLRTGEGVGEEPNHTTSRKHGHLLIIQYSLEYDDFFDAPICTVHATVLVDFNDLYLLEKTNVSADLYSIIYHISRFFMTMLAIKTSAVDQETPSLL